MDAAVPPAPDWSLLPLDALASVFVRIDVLTAAGQVCRSWRDAAKLPDVWRVVEMDSGYWKYKERLNKLRGLARVAVDRSDGQLQVFAGRQFVTEKFFKYLVERSPSLTTLRLVSCFPESPCVTAGVLEESPLRELRTLELDEVNIDVQELADVLETCPALEHLTVRDCLGTYNEEHVLREKFAWIKTLIFDDEGIYEE